MKIKIPPLPKSTDKLFTSEEDWWNNSCLNYLPDGWAIYTAGYGKAADIIVDWIGSEKHFQDALVFPVIFLYRQYLELTIKDLIRQGHKLLDIKQRFPKTHKIDELWKICERLVRKISPGDSGKELRQIGGLIGDFCRVDPTSMAFRYP